jgi:hypothetical protein
MTPLRGSYIIAPSGLSHGRPCGAVMDFLNGFQDKTVLFGLLPAACCLLFSYLFRQNISCFVNGSVSVREEENYHADNEEED